MFFSLFFLFFEEGGEFQSEECVKFFIKPEIQKTTKERKERTKGRKKNKKREKGKEEKIEKKEGLPPLPFFFFFFKGGGGGEFQSEGE